MKLTLAYTFRKMFFIGQNLKHAHDIFFSSTFDHLLINSSGYLVFAVYFSPHQRNTVWEMKNIVYFHLVLILMLKKPVS